MQIHNTKTNMLYRKSIESEGSVGRYSSTRDSIGIFPTAFAKTNKRYAISQYRSKRKAIVLSRPVFIIIHLFTDGRHQYDNNLINMMGTQP